MRTLENFPEDFQPLVVITGDRREIPPKSRGDMLAYSVSSTDFMYLNFLDIKKALVVSDKQFVIDSEEILRKRFGATNILVIGSPAVNLFARKINDYCQFRFSISEETKEELKEQYDFIDEFIQFQDDLYIYQQCLEGIFDINSILARFIGLEPNIYALKEKAIRIVKEFKKTKISKVIKSNARPIRYLMHKLDKPGIFDPITKNNRGESISANKDYGIITILDNPFCDKEKYKIIYVAGVHGPGTALGIKLLSDKNAFKDHPYGGVFEVFIDLFAFYFDKFQSGGVRWETPPYTINNYTESILLNQRENIKIFLSSPAPKADRSQKSFNNNLKNILIEICENINYSPQIEGPYTLPMAPEHDFWQAILNYEKDCSFIIHDVTNFARGVMVEIGFSYGIKKRHFLIWNSQRTPFENLKQDTIPKLLPVQNIEPINIKDRKNTKEILEKKITLKAIKENYKFECDECDSQNNESNKELVYIYSKETELIKYLVKQLNQRGLKLIDEDEINKELRICKICQAMYLASYTFIEISNSDLDSFIVLGISKAIGKKIFPLSLSKYGEKEFPWATSVHSYALENIPEQLDTKIAKFLRFN